MHFTIELPRTVKGLKCGRCSEQKHEPVINAHDGFTGVSGNCCLTCIKELLIVANTTKENPAFMELQKRRKEAEQKKKEIKKAGKFKVELLKL